MIKPKYFNWESAPLAFYFFVTRFQLPVGLVLNFLVSVGRYLNNPFPWYESLFCIVIIFCNWFALDCLKHTEWRGVRAYLFMFFIRFADYFISAALFLFSKEHYSSALMFFYSFGYGLWAFLCWIYFSNRRPLFSPYFNSIDKSNGENSSSDVSNPDLDDLISEINKAIDSSAKL
jgi:hypothetical protein